MNADDIVPDNFTYSTLIKGIRTESKNQSGITNHHDLEKAFSLLADMKRLG